MMKNYSLRNGNPVAAYLNKNAEELTRHDIVEFVFGNNIDAVNFMYPAADGRLKTLNFAITTPQHLDTLLTYGERVDGSSLFPFVSSGSSDLYVVPVFRTAFIDPNPAIPTLCLLCAYFDKDGNRLASSAEYTLQKALKAFEQQTGMQFEAMAELEYYVIGAANDNTRHYPTVAQKGYHESAPFAAFGQVRQECMLAIARAGGQIKYAHAEVGSFNRDGLVYEQNEIEFQPTHPQQAAEQVMIAKWIIRNVANKHGLQVSFAPKIANGEAGSGMHIHLRLMKNGLNLMADNGQISEIARRAIAGMIEMAGSITAFGNTNPTSYLRLVPHQEAPTNICWGDRNRSVLIRVPLGWSGKQNMAAAVNPSERDELPPTGSRQTVEMRSPDASADINLLLAALCTACRHGLTMPPEDALRIAERSYVDVNIHAADNHQRCNNLDKLPDSCSASALRLEQQRQLYEDMDVFSGEVIDSTLRKLRSYNDESLREAIAKNSALMTKLVGEYFHCG